LNLHAPVGWQRNLFSYTIGRDGTCGATRRFKTAWSREDVLSLAFESNPAFAESDGRVSGGIISERFGINAMAHGFDADKQNGISSELLDEEWLRALGTYARPYGGAHPHRYVGTYEGECRTRAAAE
jgi:hypothetical protein